MHFIVDNVSHPPYNILSRARNHSEKDGSVRKCQQKPCQVKKESDTYGGFSHKGSLVGIKENF